MARKHDIIEIKAFSIYYSTTTEYASFTNGKGKKSMAIK